MIKTKSITFLKAFLTKNGLPPIYHEIIDDNKAFNSNIERDTDSIQEKRVLLVKDFPDYLNIRIRKKPNQKLKKVKTLKGHLIELKTFNSISEYLNRNFSSKSRSNLRRYNNRLEACFNIKYVSYYGNIEKQKYDSLFVALKDLLIKRFNEKKETNYELQYLDEFHDIVYPLILNKKANLFVIYDGDVPISIRVNMFKQTHAFYILSGYDIDYSKFHLGSIDMLKNIEWCINKDFEVYDLLKGYDYYKSKWATKSHNYYNHIIYNTNLASTNLIGIFVYNKEKFKYKIYNSLKINQLKLKYKKIKKSIFGNNKKASVLLSNFIANNNIEKTLINIQENNEYAILKRPLYNFLFLTNQSINDIKISKLKNSSNKFLLESKVKTQLLTIV